MSNCEALVHQLAHRNLVVKSAVDAGYGDHSGRLANVGDFPQDMRPVSLEASHLLGAVVQRVGQRRRNMRFHAGGVDALLRSSAAWASNSDSVSIQLDASSSPRREGDPAARQRRTDDARVGNEGRSSRSVPIDRLSAGQAPRETRREFAVVRDLTFPHRLCGGGRLGSASALTILMVNRCGVAMSFGMATLRRVRKRSACEGYN
jgi:hypothetical protein